MTIAAIFEDTIFSNSIVLHREGWYALTSEQLYLHVSDVVYLYDGREKVHSYQRSIFSTSTVYKYKNNKLHIDIHLGTPSDYI